MTPTETLATPPALHNFRPVGGFATRDGRQVRADRVFRSAAPMREPATATTDVVGSGVRTIVDLRDSGERARTPGAWQHDELTVHHIPVFDDQLRDLPFDTLDELYGHMVNSFGGQLGAAVSTIAAGANDGVLLHCTAGKDRTGVISALMLDVLDVDRNTILDDFSASQRLLGADYLADLFAGHDPASLPGMAAHKATASPPELLITMFARVEHQHGSSEAFLRANGVTDASLTALATALIAP